MITIIKDQYSPDYIVYTGARVVFLSAEEIGQLLGGN